MTDPTVHAPPLTWLYVPGDRPDRIPKALAGPADVVIIDLEDAVGPPAKGAARDTAVRTLLDAAWAGRPVEVRVNDLRSAWGPADLRALGDVARRRAAPFRVRVPKMSSPAEVAAVLDALGPSPDVTLTCLLESALGVEQAFGIASAHPRVAAIALGEADLASDLGTTDESGLAWARARVVMAARAARLPSPAMSAWLRIPDLDGLTASCRAGRTMGFLGRAAVHPSQLPVIEAAFLPSPDEVAAAQALLHALGVTAAEDGAAPGGGAMTPDGRFVDRALLGNAQRTLRLAARGRAPA